MKPRAIIFTGLPKIHKEHMPIRPLINYTSAPSYIVAKKLQLILKNSIKLTHVHSVKNSPVSYTHLDVYKRQSVLLIFFQLHKITIIWKASKLTKFTFPLLNTHTCTRKKRRFEIIHCHTQLCQSCKSTQFMKKYFTSLIFLLCVCVCVLSLIHIQMCIRDRCVHERTMTQFPKHSSACNYPIYS